MATLRGFAQKFFAQDGRSTTQEWVRLQIFNRTSSRGPTAPTTERNDYNVTESERRRKKLAARSSTCLYSVARILKSVAHSWNTRFPAWRGGLAGFSILTTVVLLTNISALIWAACHLDKRPYASVIVGSYKSVAAESYRVHLAINVFSTALLAGSNYCMQCLSSPTRHEVDAEHARSSYLNIGILSWRNVTSVRKRRICLLLVLVLSSVPLHFAYNSAVVVGRAVQEYDMALVTPGFLLGDPWTQHGGEDRLQALHNQAIKGKIWDKSRWENLTVAECKDHYQFFQSDRGSVLLVTEDRRASGTRSYPSEILEANETRTALWYQTVGPYYEYYEKSREMWKWQQQSVAEWRVYDQQLSPIVYCLSLKVPYRCRLQIHIWFLLAVVVLNIVKLACMMQSFWEQHGTPLMTVGDAIASFLNTPCEHSKGLCLLSDHELISALKDRGNDEGFTEGEWAKVFRATPLRYYDSVSFLRWVIYTASCVLLILVAAYYYNRILLQYRADHMYNIDFRTFWEMGFGNLYAKSNGYWARPWCTQNTTSTKKYLKCLFSGNETFHRLLEASPQLLVSAIYIALNYHLTAMVQLRDWTRLAIHRLPLRVSNPEPDSEQVSTYWLSLPYQYSIPQLMSSVILGWFGSQAIFFYRLEWYDDVGHVLEAPNPNIWIQKWSVPIGLWYGVGYSALGVLCSIVFGIIILLGSLALGFQKCAPGLPLSPANSLVVAAACHPPEYDFHAARRLVKWGAISSGNEAERQLRHCTITSRKVESPVEGRMYA